MQISTLPDNLIYLIEEYNNNVKTDVNNNRYSAKQQELWAPKGKCKAITQQSIGTDSDNCLRLLKECGFDGEPVSSQKISIVRKWFESTNGHLFTPQKDILRLTLFFCLDFYHAIHLVLKAGFEQYLFEQDSDWKYLCGSSYIEILSKYQNEENEETLQKKLREFSNQINIEELFQLFEDHWHFSSENGYCKDALKALSEKIIIGKYVLHANHDPLITTLAEQERKLIEQIKYGTPETQEDLWRKRSIWQVLQDDLDDLYFTIEKTRFSHAEIEQDYLRLFGDLIISQIEFQTAIKLAELRIGLIRKNPGISEEDLQKEMLKTQTRLNSELEEIKLKESIAKDRVCVEAWSTSGIPMDREQISQEIALCKTEISKIRKMVHPDHLHNNPEYANLSKKHKKELEDILLDSLKITPAELGFPPSFGRRDMRSLEGLRQVRRRIEIILKINNIQVDLQYQIQGETIEEQIEWLEREIKLLENRINITKGQLSAMLTNTEVQAKKNLLSKPDQQADFRKQMQEQNDKLEKVSKDKIKELAELEKGRQK